MTELLLVRHGETDWNAELRWQGHADPPLNARGREQARALAEQLSGERFDAVYTSDLRRARETADEVAARLGIEPVPLADLREVDVGEWSGLTYAEIEARWPGAERWHVGETPEAMAERVVAAARRIAAEHPDGRVLLVSHGGPIRAIRAAAARLPYAEHRKADPAAAGNCSIHGFSCKSGEFRSLD